ncbi:MAG: type II toxin-antitoxin system HicB family antitoxin [Dehalococcoidia bacterium]|nr:type II toxin-antitoxin system HicB family antitoxin [Dehalococcoidia bacterium]
MSIDLDMKNKAEQLASRSYSEQLAVENTPDGRPVYLFSHPELPGCMTQGQTIEEARKNLENATVEYILSLLEDGLPVPPPRGNISLTGDAASASGTIMGEVRGSSQVRVEQHRLYEVSLEAVA